MKFAYDCQGGDRAPEAIVEGALEAEKKLGIVAYFYGSEEILKKMPNVARERIVDAIEEITQEESPAMAIRRKSKSAMVLALKDLRDGKVDGMISAGSTGALLAGGMFITGRIEGVERAALPILLNGTMILDVGANMDTTPEMLLSFGKMARAYMIAVQEVSEPRVALLNVGAEEGKGNRQTKEAFSLFQDAMPGFIGNAEARDVFSQAADIIVCDGFSGNILLKGMEGVIGFVQRGFQSVLASGAYAPDVAQTVVAAAKQAMGGLDYRRYGGAPLLGLKKPLMKAHGSSGPEAIFSASVSLQKMIDNNAIAIMEGEYR